MLPVAAPTKGQSEHSTTTNGSSRYRQKKPSTMNMVTPDVTNVTPSKASKGPTTLFVKTSAAPGVSGTSSSPTGGSGASSIGCVRWCMNVALQSFSGEPWALTLQPVAEKEGTISGSFRESRADCAAPMSSTSLHSAVTTVTSAGVSSSCEQPPQAQESPSGVCDGGRRGTSPGCTPPNPRMAASLPRAGQLLTAIDYSNPSPQYPGGPVVDASVFGYDPLSEDTAALHQCVSAVNNPPVTYGVDDLLSRITNVEFVAEEGTPLESTAGMVMHYRLASSLEPMFNATLGPAITAVVDHCVNSVVVVYGATQEMKQMGLIGTPEECGLLPHGIRALMERFLERKEYQLSRAASANSPAEPIHDRAAASAVSGGANASSSTPHRVTGGICPTGRCGDEAVCDSEHTDGAQNHTAASKGCGFFFSSIGSRHHRFVRMEATFVAFDSTSVVDLLDLSNKHVELVLKLAPPPTPSPFEEMTDDVNSPTNLSATTDSFVLNAQAMSVENTNDALSALDVGLENLSKALELALLQSESGSSLLFSLTAFTDTCRCATMHVMCLAEDPAAQTWLASTVQARSQAIPLGEEQSWASIQNTPMPPPLHHHAATMLVPALCFGNVFTSALICVYNSITALSRLNRDLTLAVTGYRMRTIPRVTMASSRRGLRKLPPSWEEYFTKEGRRYFIDTATQTTTWQDPRINSSHRLSRSGGSSASNLSGGGSSGTSSRSHRNRGSQYRPSRIALGMGDKDFLADRLQQEMHGGGVTPMAIGSISQRPGRGVRRSLTLDTPDTGEDVLDVGIIVVDTTCRPRVLINPKSPQFSLQYREEEELLHAKQRELDKAAAELQRKAEMKTPASILQAEDARAPQDAGRASVLATAKLGDAGQVVADSAQLVQMTNLFDSRSLQPARGAALDDVNDAELSTLCRSGSVNIEDFIVGGGSAADDDAGNPPKASAPMDASSQLTDLVNSITKGDIDKSTELKGCNAEARFYATVLQEQTASPAEVKTASSMPSAPTSPTSVSQIAGVTAQGGSRGTVSAVSCKRGLGESSDVPQCSPAISPLPPEVQDLDSLVDEFTLFYRKTFQLQERVVELESELGKQKLSAHSPSPLASAASLSATGLLELVQHMRDAVEASPSAEVHSVISPMLATTVSNTPASETAMVVLAAFREALRLAAQNTRT